MLRFNESALSNGTLMGVVSLAAPKSLNVLNLDMVKALHEGLLRWESDPRILFVCLVGEGRSFCAGGDVVSLRDSVLCGDEYLKDFFTFEYQLDLLLHQYAKPLVCFAHGHLIGGGAGLFSAARYKVVNETTRFSMPEVRIGFYPDVGASWFLGRLPYGVGLFAGFTGCAILPHDLIMLGLADSLMPFATAEEFCHYLSSASWPDRLEDAGQRLDELLIHDRIPSGSGVLYPFCQKIDDIRQSVNSASEYFHALMSMQIPAHWYQQVLADLRYASPHSLAMVYQLLSGTPVDTPVEAFHLEWGLSLAACQHPDFSEGVRALLVDKDKSPNWQTNAIEAVEQGGIVTLFEQASLARGNPFNKDWNS